MAGREAASKCSETERMKPKRERAGGRESCDEDRRQQASNGDNSKIEQPIIGRIWSLPSWHF